MNHRNLFIFKAILFCNPAKSNRQESYQVEMHCLAPILLSISLRFIFNDWPYSFQQCNFNCFKRRESSFIIQAALRLGTIFSWSFTAQKRGTMDSKSASPSEMETYSFQKAVILITSLQCRYIWLNEYAQREQFLEFLVKCVPTESIIGQSNIP